MQESSTIEREKIPVSGARGNSGNSALVADAAAKSNSKRRPTVSQVSAPRLERPITIVRTDGGLPLVARAGNRAIGYRVAKRLLDIAGSLAAILLFAPIMLPLLLVLTITTKGRPLFRQERLGLCGRPFSMYKFRSMRLDAEQIRHQVENEADGPIFKNRNDPRMTRIGRFIRRTSLDETPQLFNVLFGQMSLVGPRPPLASEVALYEPWQLGRLSIKPGLTCKWQVSGRSEIGFEDWVRMDLWYAQHQSLWTDLSLLAQTPYTVLTGKGAY